MPATPTPPPDARPDATPAQVPTEPHALLDALAPILAELSRDSGDDAGATLVRARRRDDAVDLGLLPLPAGCHPAELLLGMVVPTEWTVAGVITTGTARDLRARTRSRVGLAYLVARDGSNASTLLGLDGEAQPTLEGTPSGLLPDLLHRSLELPTPPAEGSSRSWLDLVWLDRLVTTAATDPQARRERRSLLALHPLHRDGAMAPAPDWPELRDAAISGAPDPCATAVRAQVTPELAAWHDCGSLSRWLTAELPTRAALLGVLDELLPPPLRRIVRATASPCPRRIPDGKSAGR